MRNTWVKCEWRSWAGWLQERQSQLPLLLQSLNQEVQSFAWKGRGSKEVAGWNEEVRQLAIAGMVLQVQQESHEAGRYIVECPLGIIATCGQGVQKCRLPMGTEGSRSPMKTGKEVLAHFLV
ncbi:hypothetical protein JZ751_000441 [Albula glossodonta]|uniref:Uncharacterized protein n=1 Tax=Albula glossodonta TaxID=121402 RepID=A0A8T2PW86_9TELE|nr:hypothetical protein JZ751_000441 [Albula glossodonta]